MIEGNTYYLLNDAHGPASGKQYAKRGDLVRLIALHHSMAIVENEVERFPVEVEMLSEQKQTLFSTGQAVTPAVVHPSNSKSKTKSKRGSKPSLF